MGLETKWQNRGYMCSEMNPIQQFCLLHFGAIEAEAFADDHAPLKGLLFVSKFHSWAHLLGRKPH